MECRPVAVISGDLLLELHCFKILYEFTVYKFSQIEINDIKLIKACLYIDFIKYKS